MLLILKFLNSSLAEVNTLSTDEGPLRWVPVIESVIPIIIHRKKVSLPECYLISFMTIYSHKTIHALDRVV